MISIFSQNDEMFTKRKELNHCNIDYKISHFNSKISEEITTKSMVDKGKQGT